MLQLLQMTPEQIESYRSIWGSFTRLGYTFPASFGPRRNRTFAFYGTLHVQDEGRISLQDLLVACSGQQHDGDQGQELQKLREDAVDSGWCIAESDPDHLEGLQQGFQLSLNSEDLPDGRVETHLLLSYGEADRHKDWYLGHCFPSRERDGEPSDPVKSHFYPVGSAYAPAEAALLSVEELARHVRGKPIVAFTGAGISSPSGIPTFCGPQGIEKHFPLWEPFPGAVAEWMIRRPGELARLLGHFQACFITAQPNVAHFALAEIEKQGNLVHLITGNGDGLHERAGSQRVNVKDTQDFTGSGEGWNRIREGTVFLVVGVSRDEHGFLSYARDQGLQVVVIAPERPSFLYAQDWFVSGSGEEVLPELAARLSAPLEA